MKEPSSKLGRMVRGALALAVSFALTVVGMPISANAASPFLGAELAEELYYRIGGDLYVVDFTDLLENRRNGADEPGTFSVTMRKGVVAGSSGETGDGTCFSDRLPRLADVQLLGSALGDADKDHDGELIWLDTVTWTLTTTPDRITSSYRVGSDELSMTVPREIVEQGPARVSSEAVVEVRVNNRTVVLDAETLYRMRSEATPAAPPVTDAYSEALSLIAGSFDDPEQFVESFHVLQLAAVTTWTDSPLHRGALLNNCVMPCVGCVAGLGLSIAAYLAIIGACAAAIATGGAALVLCISALIGYNATAMLGVATCAICVACASCPCKDKPACDCA